MPAVTVDNPLTLPRVATPDPATTTSRPVLTVVTAPEGYEGEGFPVRRAFAKINTKFLDPFIMMDQMGEVEYAAGEPKGTPWHPHRGFETVTYLIDGEFIHKDSHGGGGHLGGGDTQWMTAGSGILHIETPPESLVQAGGLFHGIQLWVNLPATDKMTAPRYQDIHGGHVKLLATPDGGAILRLIAGQLDGHQGPGATHTPITLLHATVTPGAQLTIPWRKDFNALAYALNGDGKVGAEGRPFHTGQAVVFGDGDTLTISADAPQDSRHPNLDVIILGGQPIREPVAWHGPFVMNSHRELQQAMLDFQSGAFGQPQ
ncbi:redox-sensitive bicupin YhaK (pirin superfamily) [Kitasatospora sp. MAP12-15]|uniref:pirin family protein n=1 Tax=unclassified Kitasatospora TaxID=2633591 RepID=UPI002475A3C9|nr:pirin family protein [Kitasatospora sp. MAP12-44]MDH6112100.1 redox-sensitive bicupin YhaK (pirin superfamily) [Kitasatospora sp. MAP12-44]